MAVNTIFAKDAYPTAPGATLGTFFKDMPGITGEQAQERTDTHVQQALEIGGQASPLVGLAVFLVLIILVYMLAKQFGEDGDFSNIKATAYNSIFISLVAVAGIPIWKTIFTRFKVPGLSTYVLSV